MWKVLATKNQLRMLTTQKLNMEIGDENKNVDIKFCPHAKFLKCQQNFQSKYSKLMSDDYWWMLVVSHIAISAGNILKLPTRNWKCLLAKSWKKVIFCPPTSCLQDMLLASSWTPVNHVTWLVWWTKSFVKVNQNKFEHMRSSINFMSFETNFEWSKWTKSFVKNLPRLLCEFCFNKQTQLFIVLTNVSLWQINKLFL